MATSTLLIKRLSEARTTGLMPMLRRRLDRATYQFKINSWIVGKWVALRGNRVRFEGVTVTLDNPTIGPREKASLYFGLYEPSEIALTRKWIPRDLPLIEFGASIGVVSCVSNRLLRTPSAHVVVEANPRIIPTLEKNRDVNNCSFIVKNAALAYGSETVEFFVSKYFVQSSLHDRGRDNVVKVTVPADSLAKVLDTHKFDRVGLIVDVEGTETDLVKNEGSLLRDRVSVLILEAHPNIVGEKANREMIATLEALGFEMVDAVPDKTVMVFRNNSMSLRQTQD